VVTGDHAVITTNSNLAGSAKDDGASIREKLTEVIDFFLKIAQGHLPREPRCWLGPRCHCADAIGDITERRRAPANSDPGHRPDQSLNRGGSADLLKASADPLAPGFAIQGSLHHATSGTAETGID
jgi:hypothetical protein